MRASMHAYARSCARVHVCECVCLHICVHSPVHINRDLDFKESHHHLGAAVCVPINNTLPTETRLGLLTLPLLKNKNR